MTSLRTGLIAEKVGMSALFTKEGARVPVTLLNVSGCSVVCHRNVNGVVALQVGFSGCRDSGRNFSKGLLGHFAKNGVRARRKLVEFRVDEDNLIPVGAELLAGHFKVGDFVDVSANTIGKGFAGAMKRHGFGGLRASHGVSVSHRSHGSTGNRKSPAKVFKNKKMAGHMGCNRVTIQNLPVVFVDEGNGLIGVKGAVPGHDGAFVVVRDAVKRSGDSAGREFPGRFVVRGDTASVLG
nr:50S ribosomal protein L3 [Candidatus Hydrogenosomobacter endosymbioticus]